jgi:hypothetical protein
MGIYLDYNINNIPEHYKDDCFVMDILKVKRTNIKYHDFHFPLAYRNFILYKNLIRAPFIQRLDVGQDVVLEEDLLFFLKSKFRKGTFHTNKKINVVNFQELERENFYLEMSKDYDQIYSNFSPDTKRILSRQREQNKLEIRDIDSTLFCSYSNDNINQDIPSFYRDLNRYKRIIDLSIEDGSALLQGVYYEDRLITVAFLRWSGNRLKFLMPISNQEGKSQKATSFLLDSIFRSICNRNVIFDFSGSSVPSIATFMKNFGVETEYYYAYSW